MGPLIVSGLFGKASMVLPFVKFIWVFCGLKAVSGGSLCVNLAMRVTMRLVCRHDGPTMPMAVLGLFMAYQRRRALMMKVLPLCLHHRAAVNWLSVKSLMKVFWYSYGVKPRICWKNVFGSVLSFWVFSFMVWWSFLLSCWRRCHRGRIWWGRRVRASFVE